MNKGFVIAFHNSEERYPYQGLTCRERAIKNFKPGLPAEILWKLRNGKQEEVLSMISLEAGLLGRDERVLKFISDKIKRGDSIFLDYKEKDAKEHNQSNYAKQFLIASILVTFDSFSFLNADLFSEKDKEDIISIVEKSQGGVLKYMDPDFEEAVFSSHHSLP